MRGRSERREVLEGYDRWVAKSPDLSEKPGGSGAGGEPPGLTLLRQTRGFPGELRARRAECGVGRGEAAASPFPASGSCKGHCAKDCPGKC